MHIDRARVLESIGVFRQGIAGPDLECGCVVFANPIHNATPIIVALGAVLGLLFHVRALWASLRPVATLAQALRAPTTGLVLHYGFWYGLALPALTAPTASNTGSALLGMVLLLVEPVACVFVMLVVEATLWIRRRLIPGD